MAATNPALGKAQQRRKLSRKDALRKMASIVEEHMSEMGLSDDQKNARVARFSKRVDRAIAARAKR